VLVPGGASEQGPGEEGLGIETGRRFGDLRRRHQRGDTRPVGLPRADLDVGPQRPRDLRVDELGQGAAADPPDELAHELSLGLHVVARSAPRLPPGRLSGQPGARRRPVVQVVHGEGLLPAGEPRGVCQDVPHLDVLLAPGGEFGPVVRDRTVEVERAPVDEDEGRETAEGLGGRPQADQRVLLPRDGSCRVGVPTPQVDLHDAVDVDRERRPQFFAGFEVCCQCCPDRFEPGRTCSFDGDHDFPDCGRRSLAHSTGRQAPRFTSAQVEGVFRRRSRSHRTARGGHVHGPVRLVTTRPEGGRRGTGPMTTAYALLMSLLVCGRRTTGSSPLRAT
jgi:hypothetical protein